MHMHGRPKHAVPLAAVKVTTELKRRALEVNFPHLFLHGGHFIFDFNSESSHDSADCKTNYTPVDAISQSYLLL